jgi:hypothetical protein
MAEDNRRRIACAPFTHFADCRDIAMLILERLQRIH